MSVDECRKLRERERSSSLSAKPGLSVHADTSSTSSTTLILGRGRPWGDKAESREEYSMRERYNQVGRLRTRSELSVPLHPPRYISHKDSAQEEIGLSTVPECDSVTERSSPSTSHSASPCSSEERPGTGASTPLHQKFEQHRMVGQEARETGSERSCHGSSSAAHVLLSEDEQMRRILNKEQEVVVTVETHKDRHNPRPLFSTPPVTWLQRRQTAPSESTDDSLTKDLIRWRRILSMGCRSEDLFMTANMASERRSASMSAATGAESDSLLRRLPAPLTKKVARSPEITHPLGFEFGASVGVHGCCATTESTQQRTATIEPVRNQRGTRESASTSMVDDKVLDAVQNVRVAAETPTPPRIRGENSGKDRTPVRVDDGPCCSTNRTSFLTPTRSTGYDPDVQTKGLHSLTGTQQRHVDQSEQNGKEDVAQQGTVSFVEELRESKSKREVSVASKDVFRALVHDCKGIQMALSTKARYGASLTGVTEFKADCPSSNATSEHLTHFIGKKESGEKVSRNAMDNLQPTLIFTPKASCSALSLLQKDKNLRFGAETPDLTQAEQIELEQVGELACLLSTVVGKPMEKACGAFSLEGSISKDIRPLPTTYTCPDGADCTERRPTMRSRSDHDSIGQPTTLTTTEVKRVVEMQELPTQAKRQGSLIDRHSQDTYRESIASSLEPPVRFTERPLAEVLASLDSEMTSITKGERRGGIRRHKSPSGEILKPPSTGPLRSTNQYDINGEDLCEVAIRHSSGEGTESYSRGLALFYKPEAAVVRPSVKPVRFLGPVSSRNIVVLPESSVAICLPEGTSRDDLWTAASGTSLRQSCATGGSSYRYRHLLLASTLEDPTFESIYNAILLPRLVTQEASGESGDVPSRPARSTSSSRAVSFDNSPMVVPLEPPPDPYAQCDISKATADAEPASPPPIRRPRRQSSLCLSSSGSLLQEMADAVDLRASRGMRRAFRRRSSVLLRHETPDSNDSAESPVLEAAEVSW